LVDNMPISNGVPTKTSATNLTRRTSGVSWSSNSSAGVSVPANNTAVFQLANPGTDEYSIYTGTVNITYGSDFWLLSNLTTSSTITFSYTIALAPVTGGTVEVEVVLLNTQTLAETIVGDTTYTVTADDTEIAGTEVSLAGSISSGKLFVRIPADGSDDELNGVLLQSATLTIE